MRGVGNRLRRFQSFGQRLPDRQDRREYHVRQDDFRNILPRFSAEARKANQGLVEVLASIAETKRATPAQIALAWLLAQESWIVPIPGTTKLDRLKENMRAAAIELTAEDLREIGDAVGRIQVQGDRYPAHLAARVGK